MISGWHHIAIICSDIDKSIQFYTMVLGFEIAHKIYRAERKSWKVDLRHPNNMAIELFTFPNAPKRNSYPESMGLRHLAFSVEDLDQALETIRIMQVPFEKIRMDDFTNKRFTFLADPDNLPIELYEK